MRSALLVPVALLQVLVMGAGCQKVAHRVEVGELRTRLEREVRSSPTPDIDARFEEYLTSGDPSQAWDTIAGYESWLAERMGVEALSLVSNEMLESHHGEHPWTDGELHVLHRLSLLYYFVALGKQREAKRQKENREAADLFYRSRTFGIAGLTRNGAVATALSQGQRIREWAPLLELEDLPAANDVGAGWARWAEIQGVLSQFQSIPDLVALYERVVALDPYFNAAVGHTALGTVFCAVPRSFGGDMELGGDHLRRALELAPEFLETWVLYAEYYLIPRGDRAELERVIRHVIDTPQDEGPYRRENALAKERAVSLMDELEDRL